MSGYYAQFASDPSGAFVVTFPDIAHGVTDAKTEELASDMAKDLLVCLLSDFVSEGKPLPAQKKYRGSKYRYIALPALADMKIQFYEAFLSSGITKAELARRMGIPRMNVDRLFNLLHHSRVDQLEVALRAIGKSLIFQVVEAA